VLKAIAELKNMTLGDLLEGIVLHAFENKTPFSPETLGSYRDCPGATKMSCRRIFCRDSFDRGV